MPNAVKALAVVLQAFEDCESTYQRLRNQYGGINLEESNRLKDLENENRRLQKLLAKANPNILMLNEWLRVNEWLNEWLRGSD